MRGLVLAMTMAMWMAVGGVVAGECYECPVYQEPVEIIVPQWDDNDAQAVAAEDGGADQTLLTIGEIEPVFIEDIPEPFAARIDTGASLCSLDVEDSRLFERDGKPWIAFTVRHRETDAAYSFEKRIQRNVLIKQKEGEPERRPLVAMHFRLGDRDVVRDVTLADRGHFEFQILLGRNLLNGMAVVDVSLANTLAAE